VSGAIDLAVGGFSSPLGCADGFAATANRHILTWLDDGASGVLSDVTFPRAIRRVAATGFMSFCVLLESAEVDCSWNFERHPRADSQPEGAPPKNGPVPYLRGATEIFMNGLCVYGLFSDDRVRRECVGSPGRDAPLRFAPSQTEMHVSPVWWERASLGHEPSRPLQPRCVLRLDQKIDCREDEYSAPAIVHHSGT
jgi:hypothetical protein